MHACLSSWFSQPRIITQAARSARLYPVRPHLLVLTACAVILRVEVPMAQQLPVRNTFIEVRAPAVIRPRSQTDFAPGPGSPVTKGIDAPVLAAAAAAPAAPPVAPVSACAVSSIETVASRRCSVIRTPDVLFPRTPLGSVSMEPPHGFALPQALDELQRRRTSTLSSEAARVQTSHSTTTRRSSLDMIPSTPDMYYSWPVDMNPAAFMLPSAAPPGPGQVAAAPVPLSTHCTKPQAQAAQAAAIGASERLAKSSAPLGNPSVTPVSWDTYAAPAPTAPTPLLVQDQKTLHNMPMWPPGHIQSTLLPSRYPMQHPQQVLVLSNFLQEAPPKMDELSAAHTDSQLYDSSALQPAGGVTTLMLRNIPVTFNREALLADFDARGLRGKYDFFYLPIDFQTGNNLGFKAKLMATRDASWSAANYLELIPTDPILHGTTVEEEEWVLKRRVREAKFDDVLRKSR
eukprot:s2561_g10.t1